MILSPERRINQNIALTFSQYEDAFVLPLVRFWGKLAAGRPPLEITEWLEESTQANDIAQKSSMNRQICSALAVFLVLTLCVVLLPG
jgi:uncharacterized Tic20 family protein